MEQANKGCEMTHKVYEYEGKHYCEEDISCRKAKR